MGGADGHDDVRVGHSALERIHPAVPLEHVGVVQLGGKTQRPHRLGREMSWNPALCTDITTASRRWNGSLANAVRRYTGAKAVGQACACSTCVSGATSGSAVSAARQKNANRWALSG